MAKRILSLLLALFLVAFSGESAAAHSAEILPGGTNRYKAVRLTPAVYHNASADLSDLLIKDGKGEPVPYFIRSGSVSESETKERYPMEQVDSYLEDDGFYFDYRLAEERDADTVATAIEFTPVGGDFMKEARLWGSHDGTHWEFVRSDPLYKVDAAEKLAIAFASPLKFTHYRLGLGNNAEQISFDAVNLVYSVATAEENYFIESISPAFQIREEERETKLMLEGLKNLRLHDVTIHTDSMFKRTVRVEELGGKELYHLTFDGQSYEDTTITFRRAIPTHDIYTLTIENGDDRPIEIQGVTVRYYADELVFEGVPGETYTLEYDGSAGRAAPSYDIARYQSEILAGEPDALALGEIRYVESEPGAGGVDRTLLFNLVVIAVAILLAAIILLRLRRK